MICPICKYDVTEDRMRAVRTISLTRIVEALIPIDLQILSSRQTCTECWDAILSAIGQRAAQLRRQP